ncbi:hypothetical protein CANCADRAFT_57650 [Tortispora caseinolytica NRRL Y-17796]|uniref:LisH domain-containing protein n=1 Tax=Tortispora caseinolytica NRRL Y-17796 TaxID=767744 RepID=A0A1E4TI09_9ASCO|nr:hypothetical protein CANCADRAFT_57650 [Tortispora caseinolytica NRRL Y-17796]
MPADDNIDILVAKYLRNNHSSAFKIFIDELGLEESYFNDEITASDSLESIVAAKKRYDNAAGIDRSNTRTDFSAFQHLLGFGTPISSRTFLATADAQIVALATGLVQDIQSCVLSTVARQLICLDLQTVQPRILLGADSVLKKVGIVLATAVLPDGNILAGTADGTLLLLSGSGQLLHSQKLHAKFLCHLKIYATANCVYVASAGADSSVAVCTYSNQQPQRSQPQLQPLHEIAVKAECITFAYCRPASHPDQSKLCLIVGIRSSMLLKVYALSEQPQTDALEPADVLGYIPLSHNTDYIKNKFEPNQMHNDPMTPLDMLSIDKTLVCAVDSTPQLRLICVQNIAYTDHSQIGTQAALMDVTTEVPQHQLSNPKLCCLASRPGVFIINGDSSAFGVDLESGKIQAHLQEHTQVKALARSPLNDSLIVGCKDGTVARWAAQT